MSFENDNYSVDKDPYEWCLRQRKRLKAIDCQRKIKMRNHKLLTQIPGDLEHAAKCRYNKICTLDDIENTLQDVMKRTNIGKYSESRRSSFKQKQPFRVDFKDKPKEKMEEVTRRTIIVTIVVKQITIPITFQSQRRKSKLLRKSQRRNPQQKILNKTEWVMPSEKNLMITKTQEKNFYWSTKRKHK
ncbi:hypothetical protein O181_066298 [Austropuccinia psidii MF-1]|uniref:Uncharacterized protein n=1 Tax=Austropuccinia psidii MF-1 TaxID=1389203 RepID=A0A9Q3I3H0_9BASI|nr:hypothetical protein [Austropuccinia psidii MF-1]